MANTLQLTVRAITTLGDFIANFAPTTLSVTLNTGVHVENVQNIGTGAGEALVNGDISGAGYLVAQNQDPTNFVQLSMASDMSSPFAKIRPGQIVVLPLASTTVYAKADTGACNLAYIMVDAPAA